MVRLRAAPSPTATSTWSRGLLSFSLVLWVWGGGLCEHRGMPPKVESGNHEEAVPPLTRPQLAEARRMRAAELLRQGRS